MSFCMLCMVAFCQSVLLKRDDDDDDDEQSGCCLEMKSLGCFPSAFGSSLCRDDISVLSLVRKRCSRNLCPRFSHWLMLCTLSIEWEKMLEQYLYILLTLVLSVDARLMLIKQWRQRGMHSVWAQHGDEWTPQTEVSCSTSWPTWLREMLLTWPWVGQYNLFSR